MVRLFLLLSPIMVVVAAVGVTAFLLPFIEVAAEKIAISRRRLKVTKAVERGHGAIPLLLFQQF